PATPQSPIGREHPLPLRWPATHNVVRAGEVIVSFHRRPELVRGRMIRIDWQLRRGSFSVCLQRSKLNRLNDFRLLPVDGDAEVRVDGARHDAMLDRERQQRLGGPEPAGLRSAQGKAVAIAPIDTEADAFLGCDKSKADESVDRIDERTVIDRAFREAPR